MGDPRDQAEACRHNPWSVEIEQSLLGSLMRDPALVDVAAADITSAHFYDDLHARIFDVMLALYADGDPPTPIIIHSVMKTDPGLAIVQGLDYLEALRTASPSTPNMRSWIKVLHDLALRRDLLKIAEQLTAAATAAPSEITGRQATDQATEALLSVGRATAKPILSLREIAMQSIQEIEDVRAGKPVPLVLTGLAKVDNEIGGFRGGDFIVLPGKSGMGKTALAVGIARNTAKAGYPTLFFSKDMVSRQIAERMVCDEDYGKYAGGIWYSRVRNHKLSAEHQDRYILAADATEGWPIEICDEAGLTMQQISARARAFKAKHGGKLGIVFIDYIQKVAPNDPRDNRERQVNAIASACKDLAKILDWPVVAGSQLNEDDKARSEKRPHPSDVRESKGIQHEADLMLSPWRPAYWVEIKKPMDATPGDVAWNSWAGDLKAVKNRFELLTLKNRHGRSQDFELFVEIGSNAIRDCDPKDVAAEAPQEEAAADLLANV